MATSTSDRALDPLVVWGMGYDADEMLTACVFVASGVHLAARWRRRNR